MNKYYIITYTYFNVEYIFGGMHFHWGSIEKQGSEHTFDHVSAPIEAHLVHYYDKASSIAGACADYQANNNLTTLAVVGVLFEIGKKHPEIDKILDNIDGSINRFKISSFIPKERQYVLYDGSLTTPPCLETVKWHLMTNKVTLSMEQLNQFRILFDDKSHFLSNNYRSTQPINNRFILYCDPDNISVVGISSLQMLTALLDTIKGQNGVLNQAMFVGIVLILLALISLCVCVIIRYKLRKPLKYINVPSSTNVPSSF